MIARRRTSWTLPMLLVTSAAAGLIGQVPGPPAGSSVITGTVRDQNGRPVVYASVRVARRFRQWNGPYYLGNVSAHSDETDDRGTFRLHSLPAGEYVVAATLPSAAGAGSAASDTATYLTTFFPGTTSLADARTITVAEQRETSITITMPSVPVTTLSGTVLRADGSPAAGYEVSLRGTPSVVGPMTVSPGITPTAGGTIVSPNGGFELKRVPSGTYTLQVTNFYRNKPDDTREIALLPIRVDQAPIRDLRIMTAPGAVARGRIVWDDESLRGPVSGQLRAVLVGTGYLQSAAIRPDGTFELTGLYGRTRFEHALGLVAAIKAVDAPASIQDGPYLTFTPGTVIDGITVRMTRRTGRLVATVLDETGRPFPSGSILLLPASPDVRDIGSGPGSTGRGFMSVTAANPRGEYLIESVPPGAYLAAAVDVPPYVVALDSELMERTRRTAMSIRIQDGELRESLRLTRLAQFVRVTQTDTGPIVR